MDRDPGLAAGVSTRDGTVYFWGGGWGGEKLPEGCGAAVTQHRVGAAGEHGCHLLSVGRGHRPQEVGPAVDAVKMAPFDPAVDLASTESDLEKLVAGDDAVLASGGPCHGARSADRRTGNATTGVPDGVNVVMTTHRVVKSTAARSRPPSVALPRDLASQRNRQAPRRIVVAVNAPSPSPPIGGVASSLRPDSAKTPRAPLARGNLAP